MTNFHFFTGTCDVRQSGKCHNGQLKGSGKVLRKTESAEGEGRKVKGA